MMPIQMSERIGLRSHIIPRTKAVQRTLWGYAMRTLVQPILAVLAIIVAVGPASATCTNGLPEPCGGLTPLTGLSGPTLDGSPGLKQQTPTPQVREVTFTLAAPIIVAAPVQLYIAATQSPTRQVLQLRQRAASLLDQIRFKGYQVSFEGLKTILSPLSQNSPDAENYLRKAKSLMGEYLLVLRDIERINLGIRIGGENYDRRVAQVQIVQGRIDAVNVDLNPLYSVHRSDATVHIEDPTPPPNCRAETVYEAHIENVMVEAGFDDRGNPIKRQGMDVVRRPKEITICD